MLPKQILRSFLPSHHNWANLQHTSTFTHKTHSLQAIDHSHRDARINTILLYLYAYMENQGRFEQKDNRQR